MSLARHHIEDLAELPEERALEIYASELCWGRLVIWMRFGLLVAVGWSAAQAAEERGWRDVLPFLDVLLLLVYFVWRRRGLEAKPFLRYGYGFLVAQVLLMRFAYVSGTGEIFSPFDFMLPGVLLVFPMPFGHLVGLYAIFWLPMAFTASGYDFLTGAHQDLGSLTGYSFYLVFFFLFSRFLYRRRVKSFTESWQRARLWALDGRRMRDELDQARRIQLSMLPQHDPYSPWLDIAGASRPATEVGGDYYGFFEVGPGRQAVVVADVAGHGVASGLLLAGVRGCLVMLHEVGAAASLPAPHVLLARLDRVVRTVGGRRTFVTMAYTLFEREPMRLVLAAAGHPPLLRLRSRDGEIEEIALPSLPLGTTLSTGFPETTVAIDPGDIFVFATDGIAEAVNPAGDLFGEERLKAAIVRAALGASASEIRDALLGELETFLGAREGQDDVTLVVVRVKTAGA